MFKASRCILRVSSQIAKTMVFQNVLQPFFHNDEESIGLLMESEELEYYCPNKSDYFIHFSSLPAQTRDSCILPSKICIWCKTAKDIFLGALFLSKNMQTIHSISTIVIDN